jgi:exopolyphosphatase / guanosine-5'-triphosphate,3'-diphosphate pyrophosphatase
VDQIVPRWEWRTFRANFGPAEEKFRALAPERVQTSVENYILDAASDANVKFRDDLLDIKQLERVNPDGLEQWRPIFKAPFPLAAGAIARLRAALGLPDSAIPGDALSFDALVAALESVSPRIRSVRVNKMRTRYHIHGCVAELTDVVADGKPIRSAAIEDEDPAKVIAAVRAMRLDGYPNMSYPRGLKQLVGMSI